ncbi:uncharacterized protein LOC100865293 [Apis florea]|uniref:uncharacterized protein LOC100865293 n=1 Tax=Apis florea TaxID=7463 RepID=UPI0012FEBA83|nr:uncharacterized protein LOC100865293 [Apis florea]
MQLVEEIVRISPKFVQGTRQCPKDPKKMKTILFLTLCIASYMMVRCDDTDDITLCLEQENLTFDDVNSLIEDKSERTIRKRGCIEACLLHKLALMNGNIFDIEKFDVYLNEIRENQKENIRNVIRQCINNAESQDKCWAAQKFTTCLVDYVKFYIKQFIFSFNDSNSISNSTSEEEELNSPL